MTTWRWWWSRLHAVFFASKVNREIDEELRFHLEEERASGLDVGMTEVEARQSAHESLGGTALTVRERIRDARGVSLVDDLGRDVRHGVRLLRRNPGFAAVVLSTLAIAIGVSVAAFSIVDAWLFRPLPFLDADRLIVGLAATRQRPDVPQVYLPYRAYLAWQGAQSLASVSAAFFKGATWRTATDAKSIVGMEVTPEFFRTLGVAPLHGRGLTVGDAAGQPAIVLAHGFWQREFGSSRSAIGSTIALNGVSYTVAGVMPPEFDMRLLDRAEGAAFWTLIRHGDAGYDANGERPVAIVARLREGIALETAHAEIAAITRRAEAPFPRNFNEFVVNLTPLQVDNTRTIRATLLTVLAAACCLLLIAAMNVGTLLLGRGLSRRGEAALRHALGADRARLARQFMAESLVLSLCGGALGVGVAALVTRLFLAWNPLGTLPANPVTLDLRAFTVALLATAVTTVVSGLVPALRLSSSGPGAALRADGGGGRTTAPAQRAQRVMLAGQMAGSVVLLVCAALLARTFLQLRAEPLGFSSRDVVVARVELPIAPYNTGPARNAFFDALEDLLRARAGVRGVAASTSAPLAAGPPVTVNLTAIDAPTPVRIGQQEVTARFFDALDIPLIAGRSFDSRDRADASAVVIINERAARDLFGDPHRAIGQRLRLDADWREVVGVVGNVRTAFYNTLEWRTDPILYRPATQAWARIANPEAVSFGVWVHVRAQRPLSAAELRAAAARAGATAAVLDFQSVTDIVAAATRQPTVRMSLLFWFCGVSLLLAAIGVYGLVAQAVADRLRELAIRLALGAEPGGVVRTLMRGALLTGAVGVVIGLALSLLLRPALESMLYGIPATDAVSMAASAALLLTVTGVAAGLPARRAMRLDPIRTLRG